MASFRAKTVQTACVALGIAQLAGVAEVTLTGWEASAFDFKLFLTLFLLALGPAIFAKDAPVLRGISLATVFYAGMQVGAWVFTTPRPPTTGELFLGALEGVAFLALAVFLTRWVASVEDIAKAEHDAETDMNSA